MSSYYTYLISSLPELHFGDKAPFPLEEFLDICSRVISGKDLGGLKNELVALDCNIDKNLLPGLKDWRRFNLSLRNELVKLRAARKKADPFKYLRGDDYASVSVTHTAASAYRNHNILEAEKMLDSERWRMLDESARGHYFDIVALAVYALKLKILLRWDKIHNSDKARLLEEALK